MLGSGYTGKKVARALSAEVAAAAAVGGNSAGSSLGVACFVALLSPSHPVSMEHYDELLVEGSRCM